MYALFCSYKFHDNCFVSPKHFRVNFFKIENACRATQKTHTQHTFVKQNAYFYRKVLIIGTFGILLDILQALDQDNFWRIYTYIHIILEFEVFMR